MKSLSKSMVHQTMVNLPEVYQTGQYFIHDGRLHNFITFYLKNSFNRKVYWLSTLKEMGYRGVILFPQMVTLRKEHTVAQDNVSSKALKSLQENFSDKIFCFMRCTGYRGV